MAASHPLQLRRPGKSRHSPGSLALCKGTPFISTVPTAHECCTGAAILNRIMVSFNGAVQFISQLQTLMAGFSYKSVPVFCAEVRVVVALVPLNLTTWASQICVAESIQCGPIELAAILCNHRMEVIVPVFHGRHKQHVHTGHGRPTICRYLQGQGRLGEQARAAPGFPQSAGGAEGTVRE
jgi:hypothetical protein